MTMTERTRRAVTAMALWLAALSPLPSGGGALADAGGPAVVTVDAAGLTRLRAEGVTVIDVRRADEWRASGVIPGSRLITAFDADGQLLPGFVTEVEREVGKDRPVALICRSGNRSATAARLLMADASDRPVYNVAGGILAWSAAMGPLVPCPSC